MQLDHQDIRLIKGMLKRGDKQSDIAAFFGCNGGRITEINLEQKHADVGTASSEELPPPGPYMAARSAFKAIQTLEALHDLIGEALQEIRKWDQSRTE